MSTEQPIPTKPTPEQAWEYLYAMTQPTITPTRAIYANIEVALMVLKPSNQPKG